jgi:thiol-disulfide isomerase/thioredoxin
MVPVSRRQKLLAVVLAAVLVVAVLLVGWVLTPSAPNVLFLPSNWSLRQADFAVQEYAPEIDDEDIDGQPLLLSDYRGRVVVVSFWVSWCGACQMLYEPERSLVRRLQGKPFALLGVNCDNERDVAKEVIAREGLTWRSWSDPGCGQGPICRRWQAGHWPALFVLDHRGMIRYRNLPPDFLDQAIEQLLGELEQEKHGAPPRPETPIETEERGSRTGV